MKKCDTNITNVFVLFGLFYVDNRCVYFYAIYGSFKYQVYSVKEIIIFMLLHVKKNNLKYVFV